MTLSQSQWNEFVATAPGGSFLQSWEWGQMQEVLHVPYWRLADNAHNVALVIKRQLPWGKSWLYVPRGPLNKASISSPSLIDQLVSLGEKEGAMFIRIEPHTEPGDGWRKAANDVQPRHTLILDLTKTDEQLLSEMHQKTRYNIRMGEKKGVTIRFSRDSEDLQHFFRLSKEVSGRSMFSFHPDEYYQAMLGNGITHLALAEHEGDVLAVHVLVVFGDTVTYVHGASGGAKRNLMAPHVLQWKSVQWAKAAGYAKYDFFGVAPVDAAADHSWTGITKFKEGFGGFRVSYLGAYDHVLDPAWYWTYSTSRRAKSLWR